MSELSNEEFVMMPGLQGHKRQIWDVLATPKTQHDRPKTYRELVMVLTEIPAPSIRRCLSEMKRDRYLVHDTPIEPFKMTFGGETVQLKNKPYKGKWRRNT